MDPTWQQFDLIAAIREWKHRSPVKWRTRHILGHQDDNPCNVLDRWATLNCEMDTRAKEHHHYHRHRQHTNQQGISGEPWRLLVDGTKVCRNFKSTVIDHIRGTRAQKYWDKRKRFKEGSSADVDWQATADAMKSMPRARQHWMTKQASGFCATGKMMQRRGEWKTAKCLRCEEEMEDSEHVLRCSGAGAKEQWQEGIKSLRKWTAEQGTACDISAAISDGLQAWYNNETPDLDGYSTEIQEVMKLQSKIGWQALLEGCPVKGWAEAQADAFPSFGSKKSGRRWVAALVKKLAETAWQMWDHRNAVNTKNETATASLELNNRIRAEFSQGFRDFGLRSKAVGDAQTDPNLALVFVGIPKSLDDTDYGSSKLSGTTQGGTAATSRSIGNVGICGMDTSTNEKYLSQQHTRPVDLIHQRRSTRRRRREVIIACLGIEGI